MSRKYKNSTNYTKRLRKITSFYNQSSIKYYTYRNPENKPLSIIIRGVPYLISDDEAKSELLYLNFPIIKLNRTLKKAYLKSSEEWQKVSTPLLTGELTNNEQGNAIVSLDRIFYLLVSVEPRRKSQTIPHSSQRFNHTKNFCHLEPRWVKYRPSPLQ